MSTKKKMIVSITSMCVVLLVAVVSVIAVWAATSASVKSNINIKYEIKHVDGYMSMAVTTRTSTDNSALTWTQMTTQDGAQMVQYNKDNAPSGTFSTNKVNIVETLGIQPMVVIEIAMGSTDYDNPYDATLTVEPIENASGYNIDEIYICKAHASSEVGSDEWRDVTGYYENPENYDKVGIDLASGGSASHEVWDSGSADGFYFYICILFNKPYSGSLSLNFGIELSNAYAA